MKMILKSKLLIITMALTVASWNFVSCGAALDEELYFDSIGKKEETTPPGNVKNLRASAFTKAVTLSWENPTDKDFYGVTISMIPAAGTLSKPLTFIKNDSTRMPTSIAVTDLPGQVTYTFTVKTFDDNLNYSSGESVSAKPEGDGTDTSGKIYGDVFDYKKDKLAYDFGYCSGETVKTIEVKSKFTVGDTSSSAFTNTGKIGSGDFSLVSVEPMGEVNPGDTIKFTVKYNPSASPSWDEKDLLIGGDPSNKLTLIGSSYKQPKDIGKTESNRNLGVKLWLRADMIVAENDLRGNKTKRIPDYSGRGYHAYCTDTSYEYSPIYKDSDPDFNNTPSIHFDDTSTTATKAQFLVLGTGSDPIISSGYGNTTFIILKSPTNSGTQYILSANNGQSFPTLVNTYRYYDDSLNGDTGTSGTAKYGWSIKGSGLQGTWRYACQSDSTTDDSNVFFTTPTPKASSICMIFDQQMDSGYSKFSDEPLRYNYPSNIRMQINGRERLLSYIHSYSTTPALLGYDYLTNELTKAQSTSSTCNGAYGKPISDAKGHRYGTLNEVKTPDGTDLTRVYDKFKGNAPSLDAGSRNTFYSWFSDYRTNTEVDNRNIDNDIKGSSNFASNFLSLLNSMKLGRTFPSNRKNDYGYTYTPYEYYEYNKSKNKFEITRTKDKSLASNENGAGGWGLFTNWISTEARRNGDIYSLLIGPDNTNSTDFKGKIVEIIMFDYALDDSELAIMNDYIKYRFGIDPATAD